MIIATSKALARVKRSVYNRGRGHNVRQQKEIYGSRCTKSCFLVTRTCRYLRPVSLSFFLQPVSCRVNILSDYELHGNREYEVLLKYQAYLNDELPTRISKTLEPALPFCPEGLRTILENNVSNVVRKCTEDDRANQQPSQILSMTQPPAETDSSTSIDRSSLQSQSENSQLVTPNNEVLVPSQTSRGIQCFNTIHPVAQNPIFLAWSSFRQKIKTSTQSCRILQSSLCLIYWTTICKKLSLGITCGPCEGTESC